jgi:hypothetical protein
MTEIDMGALDVREKLAHIDQMLADHERIYADTKRINADHDRKRQEIRYAPLALIFTGMASAAAFFAAGVAFVKVFGQ